MTRGLTGRFWSCLESALTVLVLCAAFGIPALCPGKLRPGNPGYGYVVDVVEAKVRSPANTMGLMP